MLEKQNKIIIVDNVRSQLELLGKSFFENGLGCRTFEYDMQYDEPLQKVRIAFFDINLTEKAVDSNYGDQEQILLNNTAVFNDLAIAINQYISKDNGPYVLIFWTANSIIVDAFKLYMRDPNRGFSDTASPILIDCIDKTPFTGEEAEQNLSQRVLELLNSNEKIKFLFDLEDNARIAGENTLDRIYNILPKGDLWGESTGLFENLDKVLSKIAASALGFEHAKENPKKAIYEGILPLLNYEFLNRESNVEWEGIVNKLIEATKFGDIVSPDINIQHKVNTLYHIENFVDHSKDVRGSLIEIDKTSQETLDTFNINDVNEWISKLLAIKDANPAQNARKTTILDNSRLIAIELSAACDFSNKKSRINKYILGVLTSNINPDIEKDINLKIRPEACYHLGGCCFNHNNNDYHIWLNLNYVFGAKPDDNRLGNTLFILKKEIIDMLGNKYASHISRIGITSL
ncbi:hypothetical protein [Elizabethkingia occulta]|uniref:hypothetical protein n=1 Tax=Elizabethkingia occulta TaxID=1867263 RepID=UPI00099AA1AD|nr:hypothetical protein [Elizabethkingia occulta]OPB95388.1 hypothetical protein BB020_17490 [Elizabethkingia occulta]